MELDVRAALRPQVLRRLSGRQLLEIAQALTGETQRQVARRLGVTQSDVSQRLMRGHRAVSEELAAAAEREYGIPPASWRR